MEWGGNLFLPWHILDDDPKSVQRPSEHRTSDFSDSNLSVSGPDLRIESVNELYTRTPVQ